MALVDTKVNVQYERRMCQHGKDSKSDLHKGASRGSSKAGTRTKKLRGQTQLLTFKEATVLMSVVNTLRGHNTLRGQVSTFNSLALDLGNMSSPA
jgi:hypothetical protein